MESTNSGVRRSSRWTVYRQIVAAMVRTGVLGYGGGPSIIPLVRYEAVNRYHWVDDAEFGEIVAFANALPGPIATKMAAYLGYRLAGWLGALTAVVAHILPSSAAMLVLFGVYAALSHSRVVAGMVAAVSPVIAVMLGMMAYEFAVKAWQGLGKGFAVLFVVMAFLLLEVLRLNSGLVVVVFLAYGAVHLRTAGRLPAWWRDRRRVRPGAGTGAEAPRTDGASSIGAEDARTCGPEGPAGEDGRGVGGGRPPSDKGASL